MPFRVIEHVVPGQHIRGYPHSTRGRQESILKLAVKQYVPFDFENAENAATILALHGIGFPKELYEPFFGALVSELRKANVHVRAIWAADVANQNASGVLNEDLLGDQVDYFDHSRDLLAMVNHFRNEMPRPIIGLAHSFGGPMLANLCTIHPRLLSAIILCEPIIFDVPNTPMGSPGALPARRRDYWPTRAAAEADLTKAYKKQGWAEDVTKIYFEHGLRSLPTSLYDPVANSKLSQEGVTLATTKHQEALSFGAVNWKEADEKLDRIFRLDQTAAERSCLAAAPQITAAYFSDLPRIRCPVLYVFGGSASFVPRSIQLELLKRTGTGIGGNGGSESGKVNEEIIEQSGHMLPFEEVGRERLATKISAWLGRWYKTYLEEEHIISELGSGNSDESGRKLSEEFLQALKLKSTDPRTISRPTKKRACHKL